MLAIKNQVGKNLMIFLAFVTLFAGCGPPGPRALLQGKKLLDQGKYPEAIEQLKNAAALLGTNAQAYNYLGLAYHQAGQFPDAGRAYQRALALNHDLTEVHYNLGCLWLAQNKLDAARTEFTAYTLRRGNSVDGLLKLGTTQLRSRDFFGAEKSFGDALRLSPQHPEALTGMGLARVQRGHADEAALYFKNALKQQPDYAPALLNLAIVQQEQLKDHASALQNYREYLALKPTPENAEAVQAIVRRLEQELNIAPRPVATAVVSQISTNATLPKSPPAEAALRAGSPPKPAPNNPTRTAGAPKPDSVASAARPSPSSSPSSVLSPRSSRPRANAGETPVEAGETPAPPPAKSSGNTEVVKLTAEPVIKPAQDVSPTVALPRGSPDEPIIVTSSVPASAAEPKGAKRSLVRRLNPLNAFGSEAKPSATSTPPPPAAAAPPAERVKPLPRYAYKSPAKPVPGNHAEAQRAFDQGLQAQRARRLSEAITDYQRAIQLDPSYYDAHYNLGLAASDARKLQTALTAYEYALALRPESLDARYSFALLLKQANYPVDAANELEKILAAHPNESRAHLALGNLYAQQLHQPAKARQHYSRVLEIDPNSPQASAIRYWLADPSH
jgi:tetratricopeptide (TPR) repeat protein